MATTSCVHSIPTENSLEQVDTEKSNEKKEDATSTRETLKEESEDFACAICFELIVPGDGALELPCSHIFHSDCIVQWLLNHQHCPICRSLLPRFDFQCQTVSTQHSNNRQLMQSEEDGTQVQSYHLTRLGFSNGIRSTTRLLFLQPGRHIKHGFLQFSSFLKLVFHEISEPFHTGQTQRNEHGSSNSRNTTRALYYRRRALEPSGRRKRNVFRRFWSKIVHKSSR